MRTPHLPSEFFTTLDEAKATGSKTLRGIAKSLISTESPDCKQTWNSGQQ